MLLFAVPLMITSTLQQLFNAIDVAIIGQFAGPQAMAAVGSNGPIINLVVNLLVGMSVGSNVVIANYIGQGHREKVSATVHTTVLIALTGGIFFGLVGMISAWPILNAMDSPPDVIYMAVKYLRLYFAGIPLMALYNFCAAILRAIGDTKRPLYFLTIAGVINIVLNLIFVIGCHLSVAGVALATIMSQAVSAALVTRSLMRMDGPTRLYLRRLHINGRMLRQILAIGLPAGIQSSVFSLSNVVIQSSVNSFGSIVIAGNAAAANVGNFVYQAMNTFQQAVTCFAGQNMGARKPARVIRALYVCLIWALVFGLVFGLASCIFGTQLLSLYTTDPQVIAVGLERLYIVCGPYFLCGVMDVMTGVLRGIGYSLLPMVVSLLGACAFRILWVVTIFAAVPTMNCLMISYPVSWALTFAVLVVFFALLWRRIQAHYTPEEMARR